MPNKPDLFAGVISALLVGGLVLLAHSAAGEHPNAQPPRCSRDTIADAQTPREAPPERLELGETKNATNKKARRVLGWAPRSNEESLVATAESLMRPGLLKDSPKEPPN